MVTCCRGGHVDAGMHVTSHQSRTRRANRGEASERSYDSDCKMQTGSCFTPPPPAAGSCRCDGRILAPAPLTLAYQRELGRRARPIPVPRLDANLPQRCRRRLDIRAPPPTPLYFHNPVQQQTSPRGRGGADFLFLLLPSHRASWLFKDDTHGAAAALIFLSLCLWRKPNPSYTSRHTQQHQQQPQPYIT